MSGTSLFGLFTAGLACFAPLAAAYTQPAGDAPKGNPIYEPNTGSVVPAGQGFTITWGPTTSGTVTLVLLKGPSTNAVPQYPIVEHIPNSGSYVWHVSGDLAATLNAQGYGIQLIDDATGQYQYSTQFGISNGAAHSSILGSSSVSPESTTCSDELSTSSTSAPAYTVSPATATSAPGYTWSSTSASSTKETSTIAPVQNSTWSTQSSTRAPLWTTVSAAPKPYNVTVVAPTGAGTAPVWTAPATYSSGLPKPTGLSPYRGAASTLNSGLAGLTLVGVAALFAVL